MATREENLKKINDELEKLDDEQLDNVTGGAPTKIGSRILKNRIPSAKYNANSQLGIAANQQVGIAQSKEHVNEIITW